MTFSQKYSDELKRAQAVEKKKSARPLAQRQNDTIPEPSKNPMTPKQKERAKPVNQLASPPPSRVQSMRDETHDRVQAFLTELPFLD